MFSQSTTQILPFVTFSAPIDEEFKCKPRGSIFNGNRWKQTMISHKYSRRWKPSNSPHLEKKNRHAHLSCCNEDTMAISELIYTLDSRKKVNWSVIQEKSISTDYPFELHATAEPLEQYVARTYLQFLWLPQVRLTYSLPPKEKQTESIYFHI